MYTFQPLVDVSNVHAGFWFMVALAAFFVWFLWPIARDEFAVGLLGYGLIALILMVSYHNSWKDRPPRNEPVTATRVGFLAEGYNEVQRHGKQHRRVDVHQLYVIYKLDSEPYSEVPFLARPGITYPDHATLYKN